MNCCFKIKLVLISLNHRSCDLCYTAVVSVTSNYYKENFLALMVL